MVVKKNCIAVRFSILVVLCLMISACATNKDLLDHKRSLSTISTELQDRTGNEVDLGTTNNLPPSIALDDGLTKDEAVVVALMNNSGYRAALSELIIASADITESRALPNPVLSLLDPVGSGILEGTLAIPLNLLRRSERIEAAELNAKSTQLDLLQTGLTLAKQVSDTYTEIELTRSRAEILQDSAESMRQQSDITRQQVEVGRRPELDLISIRSDYASIRLAAQAASDDVKRLTFSLAMLIGQFLEPNDVVTEPNYSVDIELPNLGSLAEAALTVRPDLIAAGLRVEAAQAGAEKLGIDILQPGLIVDIGQAKGESMQTGGGASITLPIFDQGQAAHLRAEAALVRAIAERDSLKLHAWEGLASGYSAYETAANALLEYDGGIIDSYQNRLALTEKSFELGRASYTDVQIARRALNDARLTRGDAIAALQRALSSINYNAGRDVVKASSEAKK